MHYLFALWDGGGTVPPELSVVRRLVQRGHTVMALGDPTLEEQVLATGATFRVWMTAPYRRSERNEDDLVRDWECRTPIELLDRLLENLIATPAARYARDVREVLSERPADAVVTSFTLLGAQLGAESAGVPFASLVPNVYPLPAEGMPPMGSGFMPARGALGRLRDRLFTALTRTLWRRGLPAMNAARAEFGLPPLREIFEQSDRAERIFVLTSRAFDFPGRLPGNVRYSGPILDDPAWTEPWAPRAGEGELVLVSLSSTYQDQRAVLQRVVDGVGRLPVRALVTTGPAIEPSSIFAAPNVEVVRSAPHSSVLKHAAAVVTHGGHGTVIKSLAAGVPVVCVPMGRDQPDNAARIVATGTGVRVSRSASAKEFSAAARSVLGSPRYREAAARLGATLRAEAAASTLIEDLEEMAQGNPLKASRGNEVPAKYVSGGRARAQIMR